MKKVQVSNISTGPVTLGSPLLATIGGGRSKIFTMTDSGLSTLQQSRDVKRLTTADIIRVSVMEDEAPATTPVIEVVTPEVVETTVEVVTPTVEAVAVEVVTPEVMETTVDVVAPEAATIGDEAAMTVAAVTPEVVAPEVVAAEDNGEAENPDAPANISEAATTDAPKKRGRPKKT